ncbi:antitoxin [Pseudomonas sp. BIC9C]|uniref:type II toxin-antitoxin system RelB family antitoxin n=1 Tax=Pseudomonas sp. BIC9C TaxID=3078458 RepID=UPI002AD277ED|nr:antitoxin [Pseudomonas sp. BIC9C]
MHWHAPAGFRYWFETDEHSASHDRWFRTKVQASLNRPSPNVPHDQVMADMRALLESKSNGHGSA